MIMQTVQDGMIHEVQVENNYCYQNKIILGKIDVHTEQGKLMLVNYIIFHIL